MSVWSGIKIWLKVVVSFLFSITLVFSSLTYALFTIKRKEMVEFTVTETVGTGNSIVVFSGYVQPMVIYNIFWFLLAGVGFFLIFLYFIEHNFRVFLGPGILALMIFVFLKMALWFAHKLLFDFAEDYGDLIVLEILNRFRDANFAVLALGLLLIGLSYLGAYFKKGAPDQPLEE